MLENNSLFFDDDELELDGPTADEEVYNFGGGKYTTKVNTVHYTPNGPCPAISDIIDTKKYEQLIAEINASNVSNDEKMFLKLAAARHCVINFGRAANYYAYASKEMQELMEHNALVIIDFNDAVRNGFIILDKRLDELINAQLEAEENEKQEA